MSHKIGSLLGLVVKPLYSLECYGPGHRLYIEVVPPAAVGTRHRHSLKFPVSSSKIGSTCTFSISLPQTGHEVACGNPKD